MCAESEVWASRSEDPSAVPGHAARTDNRKEDLYDDRSDTLEHMELGAVIWIVEADTVEHNYSAELSLAFGWR